MAQDAEIALALSAGPAELAKGAAVYVLHRGGYVKAREGINGCACLVIHERSVTSEPTCYDPEGTQSNLPVDLFEAELREQGKSNAEIEKLVNAGYQSGKFHAPKRAGVAYMLSHQNHVWSDSSSKVITYAPHVMIYAPNLKNSDIGVSEAAMGSTTQPWVLNEGTPRAYIIVVPSEK